MGAKNLLFPIGKDWTGDFRVGVAGISWQSGLCISSPFEQGLRTRGRGWFWKAAQTCARQPICTLIGVMGRDAIHPLAGLSKHVADGRRRIG